MDNILPDPDSVDNHVSQANNLSHYSEFNPMQSTELQPVIGTSTLAAMVNQKDPSLKVLDCST
jgi:hypothetical protein